MIDNRITPLEIMPRCSEAWFDRGIAPAGFNASDGISDWAGSYVIMMTHGGTMDIRGEEGDGCRIIPDTAYGVIL